MNTALNIPQEVNHPITAAPDMSAKQRTQQIAFYNDQFRKAAVGHPVEGIIPEGQMVITAGISERDEGFLLELMKAVGAYDTFNRDADPYEEHEMGVMQIQGETVWFKVDIYDQNYECGSPDPTNLNLTRRVLTLLLPSEY